MKSQSLSSGFRFLAARPRSFPSRSFVSWESSSRIHRRIISVDERSPALREVPVRPRLHKWMLFLCLISFLPVAHAPGFAGQSTRRDVNPPADEDEARARITHDMEKRAAKERVAALKNDTDRLLKLSVEH